MKNILVLLFSSFLWSACQDKYPGFTELEDGLYQKIIVIGEEQKTACSTCFVKINISQSKDLVSKTIQEDTGLYVPMSPPPYSDPLLKVLSNMSLGDSVLYIIESKEGLIEQVLHISIKEVLSTEEYEYKMADLELRSEKKEMEEMDGFFAQHPIKDWKIDNGMYYHFDQMGEGDAPKKGDWVVLHYTGYNLKGKKLDSTYETEAFGFSYGDPLQVIKGFEMALSKMKKGSKLKIVIPSQLGFGSTGTSDKTIRPYTPLLYELELIDIKKTL